MKIGNYTGMTTEAEQHRKNARRENAFFERGVIPEVGEYDNHEIHTAEHRAYFLQMNFNVFKRKNPELAQMFLMHHEIARTGESRYRSEDSTNNDAAAGNGAAKCGYTAERQVIVWQER